MHIFIINFIIELYFLHLLRGPRSKIIFFLPLILAVLIMFLLFMAGIGLLVSLLNVFLRDIGHLLGVLLMCWFWITPVFYSLEMLPLKFRWVVAANPVSSYIIDFRVLIFYGQVPSLIDFLVLFIFSVLSLLLGLLVFGRYESNLLKRI